MYELVYWSVANPDLNGSDIENLFDKSKNHNLENKITGFLFFYNKQFIQIIEGEKNIIYALFENIKKDTRHTNVLLLAESEIKERIFENWTMNYHNLNPNESENFSKTLFINNITTLAQFAPKTTQASRLFWLMVKKLTEQ